MWSNLFYDEREPWFEPTSLQEMKFDARVDEREEPKLTIELPDSLHEPNFAEEPFAPDLVTSPLLADDCDNGFVEDFCELMHSPNEDDPVIEHHNDQHAETLAAAAANLKPTSSSDEEYTPQLSDSESPSPAKRRRKRKRKRQRPPRPSYEPSRKVYVSIRDLDVLCQRGGLANSHPGNVRYRSAKDELQEKYLASPDDAKRHVSQELVDAVHAWGGRFVQQDDGGNWYVAHPLKAREKASQALRERLTPQDRAAKRARYAKKRRR